MTRGADGAPLHPGRPEPGVPATRHWHLSIDARGRPGHENMALDWALLRAATEGPAFLRLYRWAPPCLSFGRNEPVRSRYDLVRIRELGLDVVRRPTGGRAVWHDQELTYAVAGPADLFGTLQQAYISIHRVIAEGLRQLGAAVDVVEASQGRVVGPDGGACFASSVGGEIVAGGLKLVGSAQVREAGAFLQHGSVLLQNGQDVVTRVSLGPGTVAAATALESVLSRPVTFDEVAEVIAAAAQRCWQGTWSAAEVPYTPEDVGRFQDPGWTFRR